jgi:hypothetical protein
MVVNYPIISVERRSPSTASHPARTSPTGTGYVFDEDTIYLSGYSFTRGVQNVQLGTSAGFATLPADLDQACAKRSRSSTASAIASAWRRKSSPARPPRTSGTCRRTSCAGSISTSRHVTRHDHRQARRRRPVLLRLRSMDSDARELLRASRAVLDHADALREGEKLSGQVLKNRTGTLRRKINYEVRETPTGITGSVGVKLSYAAAHEYGFDGVVTSASTCAAPSRDPAVAAIDGYNRSPKARGGIRAHSGTCTCPSGRSSGVRSARTRRSFAAAARGRARGGPVTSREAIFAALFAKVSASAAPSREPHAAGVGPTRRAGRAARAVPGRRPQTAPRCRVAQPTKWTFRAELVLYVHARRAARTTSSALNTEVDAIVARSIASRQRPQTLGGLVTTAASPATSRPTKDGSASRPLPSSPSRSSPMFETTRTSRADTDETRAVRARGELRSGRGVSPRATDASSRSGSRSTSNLGAGSTNSCTTASTRQRRISRSSLAFTCKPPQRIGPCCINSDLGTCSASSAPAASTFRASSARCRTSRRLQLQPEGAVRPESVPARRRARPGQDQRQGEVRQPERRHGERSLLRRSNASARRITSSVRATIPTTPFQVTVANGATFKEDLGVTYGRHGRAAHSASVGAGDRPVQREQRDGRLHVRRGRHRLGRCYIDYAYTVGGSGNTTTINNLLSGSPLRRSSISLPMKYNGKSMYLRLNACVSSKLTLATKIEDFMVPEFDFMAFADAANVIGTLSMHGVVCRLPQRTPRFKGQPIDLGGKEYFRRAAAGARCRQGTAAAHPEIKFAGGVPSRRRTSTRSSTSPTRRSAQLPGDDEARAARAHRSRQRQGRLPHDHGHLSGSSRSRTTEGNAGAGAATP